jgi:hypothetical protein
LEQTAKAITLKGISTLPIVPRYNMPIIEITFEFLKIRPKVY